MLSPYLKRIAIDVLLIMALALGILYFGKVFIDYIISLFHFNEMINISSIVYLIQRFVYAFLPLIILTVKFPFEKIKVLKSLFYITGCCYILGNCWIFYFLPHHSFSTILTASIPVWFADDTLLQSINEAFKICHDFQFNNALVFNYLIWGSYDLFGIIFSLVQGFLFIRMGYLIEDHKSNVVKRFLVLILFSLLVPFIYGFVVRGFFWFTEDSSIKRCIFNEWIQRNAFLVFESFFIYFALKLASTTRSFWADILY